jgi:hypothetical protein
MAGKALGAFALLCLYLGGWGGICVIEEMAQREPLAEVRIGPIRRVVRHLGVVEAENAPFDMGLWRLGQLEGY